MCAAWDCDDDWISMCMVFVCLIQYYIMLNLTNIEDNHYKYYTSYYLFFQQFVIRNMNCTM